MNPAPEPSRPSFAEILDEVYTITCGQIGTSREKLRPGSRLLDDLGMESLDMIEWIMEIEDCFDISLPDHDQVEDQVYKQVFTRRGFCIRDVVELIMMRWDGGRRPRPEEEIHPLVDLQKAGFAQLSWDLDPADEPDRGYDAIGAASAAPRILRRRADGMPCVLVPGGEFHAGQDGRGVGEDERPVHRLRLSPYLIDQELVSTTAYCRFLNNLDNRDPAVLASWYLLADDDHRRHHESIQLIDGWFRPRPGTDEWPMILVSWHGARAYARWAHGEDPLDESGPSYLPSEAQWEFAVRGDARTIWPWGDEDPRPGLLRAGRARQAMETGAMPFGPVHAIDGTSVFGLRGALGHAWQWCSDWYAPDSYGRRFDGDLDPVGLEATGIRAERGGSWVGGLSLCRPAYRRGRVPHARGRCLGFRCAVPVADRNLGEVEG